MIQKSDAESIAVKLKAEVTPGRKHQWATFTLEDRAYKFSIRHGSKSDHSHLVNDLRLPLSRLQALSRCHMSAEEYFSKLRGND